jgi:hypothetical protein
MERPSMGFMACPWHGSEQVPHMEKKVRILYRLMKRSPMRRNLRPRQILVLFEGLIKMPSNPVPPLSQRKLKQLHKLLFKFCKYIAAEQGVAGDIIYRIMEWVRSDLDPKDGENSYNPRY